MNSTEGNDVLDRLTEQWPDLDRDPVIWHNVVLDHEPHADVIDAVQWLKAHHGTEPPRPADLRAALREVRREQQPEPYDGPVWRRGLDQAREALHSAA